MKKPFILGLLLSLLLSLSDAHGALYFTSFNSGGAVGNIPDGNPIGAAFGGTVNNAAGLMVSGLTVGLNLSGGYNGNLYAYLIAPNGTLVVLLDQPGVGVNGFGASGAGMNITLQTSGAAQGSIQNETSDSFLSGVYNAAGNLTSFDGSAANGAWTLYFADLVSGGGSSTVNSWSLEVTAVPEPVNVALLIFALVALVLRAQRYFRPLKNNANASTD